MNKNTKIGTLYIVATPIGNLDDISKRALDTLSKVDFCAAEDTRKSKILLSHYQIKTKLISYHKYSEHKKLFNLIDKLKKGNSIALISDAGTPLISDPGYLLVNKALQLSINVIPIPGPSSLIAAVSVSGFPTDRFIFYGFPPRQLKARKEFIGILVNETKTSILFESGLRIEAFLQNLKELSPKREIFIAREMTKIHETFYLGKVTKVLKLLSSGEHSLKGEFVIVIKGKLERDKYNEINTEQRRILNILLESLRKNEALSLASKIFKINKNIIYKNLLKDN